MLLPEEILSYISTTVDSGIGATFGIARVRRTCSSCYGVLKPRLRPGWAKVVEQRPCHDCRVAIDAGEDISVRCALDGATAIISSPGAANDIFIEVHAIRH